MTWQCACGARNAKKSTMCEDCGAEQGKPSGASPAIPKVKPLAPWEQPLCEHVQVAGTMCPNCEEEVKHLKATFFGHLAKIHTVQAPSRRRA